MPLGSQNKTGRYGMVAILLHWLIAGVIFLQLWIGFWMEDLAKGSFDRFQALQWHKSVGLTILILSVVRLLWRLMHPAPPPSVFLKPLEQRLARATHFALYFLIIAVPLAGWATVSASPLGLPITLYGVIDWPHIPMLAGAADQKALEHFLEEIHETLVFSLVGLFLLHILAALRHQYLLKDNMLARMVPWLGRQASPKNKI
jgi:cytochrome b561